MPPIKRHHCSTGSGRERYDRCVCNTLARLACLVRGEEVVAQLPQALDHRITEILIGVEQGHRLDFRRLLDGLVNRVAMGGIIGPGGI